MNKISNSVLLCVFAFTLMLVIMILVVFYNDYSFVPLVYSVTHMKHYNSDGSKKTVENDDSVINDGYRNKNKIDLQTDGY